MKGKTGEKALPAKSLPGYIGRLSIVSPSTHPVGQQLESPACGSPCQQLESPPLKRWGDKITIFIQKVRSTLVCICKWNQTFCFKLLLSKLACGSYFGETYFSGSFIFIVVAVVLFLCMSVCSGAIIYIYIYKNCCLKFVDCFVIGARYHSEIPLKNSLEML